MAKVEPKRQDRLATHLHPTTRFFWGLGLLACLVFAGNWEARAALAALGMTLALITGKRVSLGYFGFLVASVVVFHLFLPVGKVWLTLGPWAITEGAFFLGLGKGLTFAGLVFFSLASISRDLRLPGKFGALWGQTFSWYEQLMERLYPTLPGAESFAKLQTTRNQSPTTLWGWVLITVTLVPGTTLAVFWR